MGTDWLFLMVLISLSLAAVFQKLGRSSIAIFKPPPQAAKLPPGPRALPIVGNFLWLWLSKSPLELRPILRSLRAKLGPAFTLYLGPRPMVVIADRFLAHQALIDNGGLLSDRPALPLLYRILSSNQHSVVSSRYGPTWRVLRRNLTSQILHPRRVKSSSYAAARHRVLHLLLTRLVDPSQPPPRLVDLFRSAMFRLLGSMCFGCGDEKQFEEMEPATRLVLSYIMRPFNILNFCPSTRLCRALFPARWAEFESIRRRRRDALLPLIQARKLMVAGGCGGDLAYVDTLFDLELPEGEEINGDHHRQGRKLEEEEIVGLCSEFLNGGTDTTATALEWIMANVVNCPAVQQKLIDEMREMIGNRPPREGVIIKEDDLEKLPYLKATVLEGLRRHPQGAMLIPHAATEEAVVGGTQLVPKQGMLTVLLAEIEWDPDVWEDPMSFRPERFLGGEFDITGRKEIKMLAFGAGRRMCPGYALALLHLEYFVANLVWRFQWKAAAAGGGIDMSEKQGVSIMMKYPLQPYFCPDVTCTELDPRRLVLRSTSDEPQVLNNLCYIIPRF